MHVTIAAGFLSLSLLASATARAQSDDPATITEDDIARLAEWMKSETLAAQGNPAETEVPSLRGATLELKGNFEFNGNSGEYDYGSGRVEYSGRPNRGDAWSGVEVSTGGASFMLYAISIYCNESETHDLEMLTVENRRSDSYEHLISREIPATIRGTIKSGEGMLGVGSVVLEDGCSIEFDVPAWTDELMQESQRLSVPLHVARAAAKVEEYSGWKVKTTAQPFADAFMEDGIYDREEVAFLDVLLNEPGVYLLDGGDGAPVPFRNYWIPRTFTEDAMAMTDSLGRLATGLKNGDFPSQVMQEVRAAMQSEPLGVEIIHDSYTADSISRDITYSIVVGEFYDAMVQSDTTNAYAPFREEVSEWYSVIKDLPEDRQIEIRRTLAYFSERAASSILYREGREIPAFLYNWISPDKKNLNE
ncbi:hypothetical protein [Aquisalinus flavus]|uniref:Uncharacterized protein n=1 Tax=Aquisalinus flavus TaxID=1526572 RepID=A0A8J2Y3C5_9PROT|nr:hypothetical protein [Aquisalinus flavus]MBD0427627.1 hypothetical protein [Aquisalinus flavus]UNE47414.1 hypothetical protein FF099_04730 [Aquisalinus flavus]GGD02507.1 hypothetical protein GCM10011342_09410 [Aquisalinus flavus]